MSSQEELRQLSGSNYWNERYAQGDEHEWISFKYEDLRPVLEHVLPPAILQPQLLHLGCGTSTLTKDLYEAGYHRQINVDFSQKAVSIMRKRYCNEGLTWLLQDIRDMKDISDGSIDVAIDKATLDAMCHGSVFDPPDEVIENVKKYMDEVARVLAPRGTFLYLTWRPPLVVRRFLERPLIWEIATRNVQKSAGGFEYCLYIMNRID